MKKCIKCGQVYEDKFDFCQKCGTKLELIEENEKVDDVVESIEEPKVVLPKTDVTEEKKGRENRECSFTKDSGNRN